MTDRENFFARFLERWSRRKIEAQRQTPGDAREEVVAHALEQKRDDNKAPAPTGDAPAASSPTDKGPAPSDTKPAFDITQLPSLDAITAATDVRAFLAPGVPAELTRAALRRAWVTDPAIRDFRGLAENDWDFTDPKAMAGFCDLPADFDAKKVIAQIFGEKDHDADAAAATRPRRDKPAVQGSDKPAEIAPAEAPETAARDGSAPEEAAEPIPSALVGDSLVHRNTNTAMHNSQSPDGKEEAKIRRTHGRALPR